MDVTEETVRQTQTKGTVNISSLRKLTAAVKDLQQVLFLSEGQKLSEQEAAAYGVVPMPEMVVPEPPEDMEGEDEG